MQTSDDGCKTLTARRRTIGHRWSPAGARDPARSLSARHFRPKSKTTPTESPLSQVRPPLPPPPAARSCSRQRGREQPGTVGPHVGVAAQSVSVEIRASLALRMAMGCRVARCDVILLHGPLHERQGARTSRALLVGFRWSARLVKGAARVWVRLRLGVALQARRGSDGAGRAGAHTQSGLVG